MTNKTKNILMETFKAMDRFSTPINLTINNHTQFKTVSGGVLTIMSIMVTMAYLMYNVNDVYNQKFSITSTSLLNDLLNDKVNHKIKDSFDVAT